nr:hypothetical protein GCM10020063_090910 [Dactylosporangium thailandense]
MSDSFLVAARLSVGPDGARFVSRAGLDLTRTVAGLRAVESEFFELAERVGEDEENWDPAAQPAFRTEVPREYVSL